MNYKQEERILLICLAVVCAGLLLLFSSPLVFGQEFEGGETWTVQPGKLLERRVQQEIPEGYDEIFDQTWMIPDSKVDWRQYDQGSIVVLTPPRNYEGKEFKVYWSCLFINWEAKSRKKLYRAFTVQVDAPAPVVPPPVLPPDDPPPDPDQVPENPTLDLSQITSDIPRWSEVINRPERAKEASSIAQVFRSFARVAPQYRTAPKLYDVCRAAVNTRLGTELLNGWRPVFLHVRYAMYEAGNQGLPQNRLGELCTAVADGFDGVVPLVVDGPRKVGVVYESLEQSAPLQALVARRQLDGIQFRIIDDDVIDRQGQIPDDLRLIVDAARQHGLPAIVLQVGDQVVRVEALPQKADDIISFAKR